MALKEFKAQAAEMTAPAVAANAARFTPARLQLVSFQDPIAARLEREEFNGSPNIDNSGRGALRMRNDAFEINKVYATSDEKEDQERRDHGGLTKAEVILVTNYQMIANYQLNEQAAAARAIIVPPHHTAGRSYTGRDGKQYTEVLDENGTRAYISNGTMCLPDKGGLSSTMEVLPGDQHIDKDQAFNITYKFVDGKFVERTAAEADFQLAMVRMENNLLKAPVEFYSSALNDPKFKTSTGTPIKTDVAPTTSFGAAATETAKAPVESVVFRKDRPETPAWLKPPEPIQVIERPELAFKM